MKKAMKTMLSLLLVLVFSIQFAGSLGFADDEARVSGKESLVYELFLLNPDKEAEEKLIPVPAEKETELLNKKPYSILLEGNGPSGDSEKKPVPMTRMPGSVVMSDLLKNDLVITPPEGFIVSQAYLRGDELKDDAKTKVLPFTASKKDASLTLKAEALAAEEDETEDTVIDEKKAIFNEDLFSSFSTADPQVYTITVVLSLVDPEAEITVTALPWRSW